MTTVGIWLFGLVVALLAFRGLVALSRTDGISDGLLGALTFGLILGFVWAVSVREERDS